MAPICFGVLVYHWQAIDVIGPLDLLNSCTKDALSYVHHHGGSTQETVDQAPEFEFHSIGETLDPVPVYTKPISIIPSVTVEDCPDLDCLIIGGPLPEGFQFPPKYIDFIKKHHAAGKTIFTTCTGASALATTGVLDGKNATVNHVEFNWVAKEYPLVKWTRKTKWVVDRNIWTSGGAVSGMDMFAHWIKTNFGFEVMLGGAIGLDFEPRDQDGLFTIVPKRFDADGKQVSSHVFP